MCLEYSKIRGVAPGTLNLELGLLRSILIHAYKHRLIPDAIYIPVPTKPAPRSDYLTRPQFKVLVGATKERHVRLFLFLAICTGARSNAILDLTWDRVSLSGRTIDLRLPGNGSRKGRAVVPINDTALKYLTEAYPLRRTEYVIEYHAKRVLKIRNSIHNIGKRVGMDVSPHMLRHSAAVWMAEGGVPMSEIAQYLGHSNTAITERVYARYSPGYLRKAASHLEIEE
jgi:integrase